MAMTVTPNISPYNKPFASQTVREEDGTRLVTMVYKNPRSDSVVQKIDRFIGDSSYNLFNVMNGTSTFFKILNEIQPKKDFVKISNWFQAATSPFIFTYLWHSIKEISSTAGDSIAKTTKKVLDLFDASLLTWGVVSSALELPKKLSFDRVKTFLGLGSAAFDIGLHAEAIAEQNKIISQHQDNAEVKSVARQKQKGHLLKICAAVMAIAGSVFAVISWVVVVSPVPAVVGLSVAFAGTLFKLSASFWEQTRKGDYVKTEALVEI